jgi:glyoxylase-like metal-dependent hydrolase (beta-lactamase superfamily II)
MRESRRVVGVDPLTSDSMISRRSMRFSIVVPLLLSLLSVAACRSADEDPTRVAAKSWRVSERLEVRELRPGIWIHTSWQWLDGTRIPSNGLVVRDGANLVLVDTAWGDEATAELLAFLDAEFGWPVTLVIVTHFHHDRLGGAQQLVARGIRFVAHQRTLELAPSVGLPLPESLGDLAPGEAVTLGGLEVFHPGPAHTRDNVIVYVAAEKVLFGGCAVRTPEMPGRGNVADADVAAWSASIRRVQERYPHVEVVVPGHGGEGDAALLEHTIQTFEDGPL